ncbi:MAG: hypothetical protein DWH97_12190 [Planctomycetota bacterium]|jgi:hypothetical protein|nr:MAG: hypothetical protein DWH97_12190 [Planctomycetota bacterium]RLS93082.1 MAG: hypothetical protein DWI12_09880 [Planctomycetota bacterium]
MKTFLALGCLSACVLLTGCDGGGDTTTIPADQVRQPDAKPVDPPGSGIKLGSNKSDAPPPPSKPAGN